MCDSPLQWTRRVWISWLQILVIESKDWREKSLRPWQEFSKANVSRRRDSAHYRCCIWQSSSCQSQEMLSLDMRLGIMSEPRVDLVISSRFHSPKTFASLIVGRYWDEGMSCRPRESWTFTDMKGFVFADNTSYDTRTYLVLMNWNSVSAQGVDILNWVKSTRGRLPQWFMRIFSRPTKAYH